MRTEVVIGEGSSPRGRGLTDALRRKMRGEHNGKPMEDIIAEVVLKHAISGKYQYLKEIFDRLEGRPVDHVKSQVEASHMHFVVPPPRMLGETDGEYVARQELEKVRRRFAERPDLEDAGGPG